MGIGAIKMYYIIIIIITTANEGTRGSFVRMTPDVVNYSWANIDLDTSI